VPRAGAAMRIDIARKRFGSAVILEGIALDIAPGARVAITGPSGVGKSTLVRIVAGLDTRFDGRVDPPGRLGMVFQEPTLLPWRSARDNITLPTGCDAATASALMAEVGLAGRESAFPGKLSLGQQRRLALARAFAARPDLFLMDEAFASLDEPTAERMRALTASLLAPRDVTALIVTHDPSEAVTLAERIIGINGTPGRVVFDCRRADLGPDPAARLRGMMRAAPD